MFSNKIRLISPRKGERKDSRLPNKILNYKIIKLKGKVSIKDYIQELKKNFNL
jgi:hypothetical protein